MMNQEKTLEVMGINDVTKDNIMEDPVLFWMCDTNGDELEQHRRYCALEEKASEFRVKTHFNKAVKFFLAKYEHEKLLDAAENGTLNNISNKTKFFIGVDNPPYKELKCGQFVADAGGLSMLTNNVFSTFCRQQITLVEKMVNVETGEEKVRIAFKNCGRWKEITVNKDVIATSAKIVQLSNSGLAVTSENSKQVVKYLAELEGLNKGDIKISQSTGKLGWCNVNGSLKFTPYDSGFTFDGESRFSNIFKSVNERGSKEIWMEFVKDIRKNGRIEPRIMLAASFASVLVKLLGALPFFVHLYGPSEGGKTLSLMLAASVWGNPDSHGDFFGNFITTPTAIEARCDFLNNFPYIVDDTAKVLKSRGNDFSDLIYLLCSGTGKDRSNQNLGLRRVNNWHNVILTSGENPIVDARDQAGAINRVIEITAGYDRIFSDGHHVAEVLKRNHGFAGKMFVDAVKLMISANPDSIHEIQKSFLQEINKAEKMQKQAISMSVILTADQIAGELIFGDKHILTVDEVAEFIKSEADVSENDRCLEFINGEIMRNINKFVIDDKNDATLNETFGRITTNGDGESRVYVISSVFDDMCRRGNFNANSFRRWAKTKNISICKGNGFTDKQRIKRDEKTMTVINLPWKDEFERDFIEIS